MVLVGKLRIQSTQVNVLDSEAVQEAIEPLQPGASRKIKRTTSIAGHICVR